jgi:ParB-like chromosome segregation protein Spo0J
MTTEKIEIRALPSKFAKSKVQDDRILWVDPEDLVIASKPLLTDGTPNPLYVGEPFDASHPTYRPSADAPADPTMAEMFASTGWAGGVVEVRKEGGCFVVEDGRTRTKAAHAANALRSDPKWKGPKDKIQIKVVVNQDDDLTAFIKGTVLNRHRRETNPMEEAAEIKVLQRLGMKDKRQIALLFGWKTTDTVGLRLKLLEAAPEVKQALIKGTHTASDVLRLAHLPPDEQVKRLAKIPAKVEGTARRSRADAAKGKEAAPKTKNTPAAVASGKRGGNKRPTEHNVIQIMDAIEGSEDPCAKVAFQVLRYTQGLISIKKAAEFLGLDKESPVYRHLKEKEDSAKAE